MGDNSENRKLERAKISIIDILGTLQDETSLEQLLHIEKWICSFDYKKDLEKYSKKHDIESKLDSVVEELRGIVPKCGTLPTEKISNPLTGANSDCKDSNTAHVDDFLYDDLETEKLCEEGLFNFKYCGKCGSHNILDTNLISHSLSREKLLYVFDVLLPKSIDGKKILDVGSRIGAVLYGAYYYTDAKHIYGVEMNKELCDIQNKIVTEFKLDDRVSIIHSDILDQEAIVSACDVIVLNNVFEFFTDTKSQVKIWKFLNQKLRKGCLLITVPSVEETLENLDIYDDYANWLQVLPPFQEENAIQFDEHALLSVHEIYMYRVK